MTDIPCDSRDSLDWDFGIFATIPLWTREPSVSAIENVSREQLRIPSEELCHVSFYAAGAYNKLYRIDYADQSVLMRVTLPVYPYHKTRGEVTTLIWLRYHTSIPVPKVIAFDDCRNNEIGFEWILMEFMTGSSAYKRWRTLTMDQKEVMTRRIAEIQAELFYHGKLHLAFKEIGTLHPATGEHVARMPIPAAPGIWVGIERFLGYRPLYDVPRGPFRSSHSWLRSQLNLLLLEKVDSYEKAKDEVTREDAQEIQASARNLLNILPKIFPEDEETEPQPAVLWHSDLGLCNILVDENGVVTAIVDWECASALPAWMTTRMPTFLQMNSRSEEPVRDYYGSDSSSEAVASKQLCDIHKVDNEGKGSLYWDDLMEYEITKLREVYKTRLKELWPDWPLPNSEIKVDFYEALIACDIGVWTKKVDEWAEKIESGNMVRWVDMFAAPKPVMYTGPNLALGIEENADSDTV